MNTEGQNGIQEHEMKSGREYPNSQRATGSAAKRSKALWVAGLAAILLCGCWMTGALSTKPKSTPPETVAAYRTRVIAELDRDLQRKDHGVRKRIESAHVTVTARGASVTQCTVKTIDGTEIAGHNGSNVSEITLVITVSWDGFIQKGGYTEFMLVFDPRTEVVKEAKFLSSNATFNWETTDWFKVGEVIGASLATFL